MMGVSLAENEYADPYDLALTDPVFRAAAARNSGSASARSYGSSYTFSANETPIIVVPSLTHAPPAQGISDRPDPRVSIVESLSQATVMSITIARPSCSIGRKSVLCQDNRSPVEGKSSSGVQVVR